MKLGDKVKSVLGALAPTLGTALGGPLGGLAGNVLASALGTTDPVKAEEVLLAGKPETLLALKNAERDFLLEMEKLGLQREQLVVDDRKNAREREIKTGDTTTRNLAYITVIGFFAVLAAQFTIAFHGVVIPEGAQRTIDITTGVLFGMMFAVKDYYFGSSAGSKAKTDILGAK